MASARTYAREDPLYMALWSFRSANRDEPSRELSLIVTKLEEACLWNDALRRKQGLLPLGLDDDDRAEGG